MLEILGFPAFYQAFFKEEDNLRDVLPPCGIKCIWLLLGHASLVAFSSIAGPVNLKQKSSS